MKTEIHKENIDISKIDNKTLFFTGIGIFLFVFYDVVNPTQYFEVGILSTSSGSKESPTYQTIANKGTMVTFGWQNTLYLNERFTTNPVTLKLYKI